MKHADQYQTGGFDHDAHLRGRVTPVNLGISAGGRVISSQPARSGPRQRLLAVVFRTADTGETSWVSAPALSSRSKVKLVGTGDHLRPAITLWPLLHLVTDGNTGDISLSIETNQKF